MTAASPNPELKESDIANCGEPSGATNQDIIVRTGDRDRHPSSVLTITAAPGKTISPTTQHALIKAARAARAQLQLNGVQ